MKACKIEPKPSSRLDNVHVEETKEACFQKPLLRKDKEEFIELINTGADGNKTDNQGKTALFQAVQSNDETKVRALITAGADVNRTDNEGKTALFYAVQIRNNESVVRALLDRGADVNRTDNEGKTALIYSVQIRNNESVVLALLDVGTDVNGTDNEGKTALIYSVQIRNNESVVRALLDRGADVNRTDNEGKTALFYAVQQSNNESVVRALIEEGNSLTSSRDIYGRTPLFYAMTSKSQSIVRYFLEKKINVRIKDNSGMNFLSFFVDHCISNPADSPDEPFISGILELLVQHGVKNNAVYEAIVCMIFCKCPLLFYSEINVPIIIFFLQLAKIYGKENEDNIDKVLKMGRKIVSDKTLCADLVPQILDLLWELGADPSSADTNGNTALHFAVCLPFHGVSSKAVMDVLKKLEEGGVTVDAKNHQSETPLLSCLSLLSDNQKLLDESSYLSSIKVLVEVCKFLITTGSNVEETTRKGDSVLHLIMKLLQQILEWGGNADIEDTCQVGNEIFILFSSTRAGTRVINHKDENLNSPLHLLASLEYPCKNSGDLADKRKVFSNFMKEILEKLVDCGIHLEARNKHGQTPLHLCRTWTAVELLLDAGAKPNVVDSEGRSPLIVAAQSKTLLKAKKSSFYPDVEIQPRAFLITVIKKGLDLWIVDEHGNSVFSFLIESEAAYLAMTMIDVACKDGCLIPDDISPSLLNDVCKNSAVDSFWRSGLIEMILKSSNLKKIKILPPLNLCCKNIVESSKNLSVDEVQNTVHWIIARQLLPHADNCTILDIAKNYPELKENLLEHVIIPGTSPHHLTWIKHSQRFRDDLEKVSRLQESEKVKSYWYHKNHVAVGSFGLVFAGINQHDGREVAIKRIEKLRMKRPEDKQEIVALSALAHCEQVVQYLSFFEDENFSYIILELMEGNLDDCLVDCQDNIAMSSTSLCKDLVKGLEYLHSLNIVHRDLKPSNILYKTIPKLSLKIADFGLSHHVAGSTSTSAYASLAGTRCWMAPELLMFTGSMSDVCSKYSDVFSCGLLLHYILSVKQHPFAPAVRTNKSDIQINHEIEANVMNGNMEGWDDSLCPEAVHLLKAMLDGDKKKRPSAGEALNHPFFWTKEKKLDLLRTLGNQPEFSCPRAKRTPPLTAVETDLEKSFGTIVKYADWNDPGYAHMSAIYAEMTRKRRRRYDSHSVVELVRFTQNAILRISDSTQSTPIRKLILEDFVFLEYFPHLVIEVYKAVTTHGWDQTREEIKYAMKK